METAFVFLIAYGTFALTSGLVLTIVPVVYEGASISFPQLQALAIEGRWQGVALILASPPAIIVLWIAIRMAGREFAEYLALNWPRPGELVRALAIMAIVLMAEGVVGSFVGAEYPSVNPYLIVKGAGGLLILLIGGCLAGPIMEEFVFRGFMFRGWSQSFLGPIGAIVLTSVVWAMTHTQYDWFGQLNIFLMGLALGHIRWRSNSTWLTMMVHSTINIFIFFTLGQYT